MQKTVVMTCIAEDLPITEAILSEGDELKPGVATINFPSSRLVHRRPIRQIYENRRPCRPRHCFLCPRRDKLHALTRTSFGIQILSNPEKKPSNRCIEASWQAARQPTCKNDTQELDSRLFKVVGVQARRAANKCQHVLGTRH